MQGIIKIQEDRLYNFLFEIYLNSYYISLIKNFNFSEIMQLMRSEKQYIIIYKELESAHLSIMREESLVGKLVIREHRFRVLIEKHKLLNLINIDGENDSAFIQPETVLLEYDMLEPEQKEYYDILYKQSIKN